MRKNSILKRFMLITLVIAATFGAANSVFADEAVSPDNPSGISINDMIADIYSGITNDTIRQMYIDGTTYFTKNSPSRVIYTAPSTAEVYDHPNFCLNTIQQKNGGYYEIADRLNDDKTEDYIKLNTEGIKTLYNLCVQTTAATAEMTDEQKMSYIMDIVKNYFTYDHEYSEAIYGNLDFLPHNTTFFENMVDHTGICTDYAKLFYILSSHCGLDSSVVRGVLNGGGHEWNSVTINGVRYSIEPQVATFVENLSSTNTYVEKVKSDNFNTNYGLVVGNF